MLFVKYVYALIKRKWRLILIFLFAFLIILWPLINFWGVFFRPVISEGIVGTFTERDLPTIVTGLISQSLIKVGESGEAEPLLAQSWEVNEDAKIYKLKLKDNLYWNDGSKVKTYDLSFSIEGAEAKVLDDFTIEFTIVDSFSPFLTLLDKPLFKKGTLIGTGPYKIKQIKKDSVFFKRLVLEPLNKEFPDIVIKFYPNEKIAKNAFKLGEVQTILGINDLSDFNGQNNINTYSQVNYSQIVAIFYNTKDLILSDQNFRLALGHATPNINSEEKAITSLSPKSWAFNPNVKEFLNKPKLSKSSLNKVKNGKDSTIILTSTSSLEEIGKKVVESWNNNGIKSALRVESGIPQDFQALLITQKIPKDPDQYSLWHSTQTETNISKFGNPRIDKDLEDGRKLIDLERRKLRYQDFQKVLLDNAPATFLYFPKFNILYMKKIEEKLKKILEVQLNQI